MCIRDSPGNSVLTHFEHQLGCGSSLKQAVTGSLRNQSPDAGRFTGHVFGRLFTYSGSIFRRLVGNLTQLGPSHTAVVRRNSLLSGHLLSLRQRIASSPRHTGGRCCLPNPFLRGPLQLAAGRGSVRYSRDGWGTFGHCRRSSPINRSKMNRSASTHQVA